MQRLSSLTLLDSDVAGVVIGRKVAHSALKQHFLPMPQAGAAPDALNIA